MIRRYLFGFASLFSLVVVLYLSIPAAAQSESEAPTSPKFPFADRLPQSASELVEMRRYFDTTVWSPEVTAQKHEGYFVELWDELLTHADKYQILGNAELGEVILGTTPVSEELEWGIRSMTFAGSRPIPQSEWKAELARWQSSGYEIVETEWHHSKFELHDQGPSTSVVAMVLHVTHPASQRRFLVKGDLKLTWRTGVEKPVPEIVDATGIRVFERTGTPAFTKVMEEMIPFDKLGKTHRTTIHPLILQDLNDDGLAELVLGGINRVYWNRGNFQFEPAELCRQDPGHVNAGIFADFTGDGIRDYLCCVKSGFPKLYEGKVGGKFDGEPRVLKFSPDRLLLPVGLTAGDIDRDGDLDVYIGQQKPGYESGDIPTPYYDCLDSFPSYLLSNDGKGEFLDVTAVSGLAGKRQRRNFSASFIDLDHDLDLDLLLTSDFSGSDIFLNDGKGQFTDITDRIRPRAAGFGMSHTFGDFDTDGRIDFVMIGMSSTTARRLTSLNLGRQEFPDYNQERMNMGYGNRLFFNKGDQFEQMKNDAAIARTGWSWGSTTLDFDNDADQDVYIVNGQTSGKTTQDYCTRFWCHDLYYKKGARPDKAVREFFGNVMVDVLNGNSVSWNGFEHNALLMNRNGKEFINVGWLMDAASELDSRAAASGDLNNDGKVDLIFEHLASRDLKQVVFVLANGFNEAHHWIGVRLVDSPRGSSPLGARVLLHLADGRQLLQHNVSGNSVWTQHDNVVHFGLGQTDTVDSLEITWPNGQVTNIEKPQVDRYHRVDSQGKVSLP